MGNTISGQENLRNFIPFHIDDFTNIEQFSVITCVNYWNTDIEHAIILRISQYNSNSGEQMYELWCDNGYFARPMSQIGFFMGNDDQKKSLLASWKRRIS